jgi:uncharacterized protein YbjT (DUF2867 family)
MNVLVTGGTGTVGSQVVREPTSRRVEAFATETAAARLER